MFVIIITLQFTPILRNIHRYGSEFFEHSRHQFALCTADLIQHADRADWLKYEYCRISIVAVNHL